MLRYIQTAHELSICPAPCSNSGAEVEIVVGTHALISDSTEFKNLGMVVVDEQHK